MAFGYRIRNQFELHFITCTVNQWVDVFTRREYIDIILGSLKFCQQNKGLRVHGWVIMTNHLHLIISSEGDRLSDIIRDFKKYTASKILNSIKTNPYESRRSWLLWLLQKEERIIFWKEGYHAIELTSQFFFDKKLNYIHLNPVRSGIIEKEEEYIYSSCGDYYGIRKGLLEIEYP